jgi:hypothetical protein
MRVVLDELIERFDSGAVLTAHPIMLDSGETYRWELKFDGVVPAFDVSAHEHGIPGYPDQRILLMVYGDDELEIARWSRKQHRYGPASIVWTLGGLRRHHRPPPG